MFGNMGLGRMNGNKRDSSFGTTQFSHESLQARCLRWSKDGYQTPSKLLDDNLRMEEGCLPSITSSFPHQLETKHPTTRCIVPGPHPHQTHR